MAPGSTNQIKEQPQEGKQQVRSKTLPHPSKLQAVGVVKRPEQGGVAHQGGSAEDIVPRPQSRLKFPGIVLIKACIEVTFFTVSIIKVLK